jgi:hypothetical protein
MFDPTMLVELESVSDDFCENPTILCWKHSLDQDLRGAYKQVEISKYAVAITTSKKDLGTKRHSLLNNTNSYDHNHDKLHVVCGLD